MFLLMLLVSLCLHKSMPVGNRILMGSLFLSMFYTDMVAFIYIISPTDLFLKIIGTGSAFSFFLGPLFYLSIRSLLEPMRDYKRSDLIHAIPGALAAIDGIRMNSLPTSEKFEFLDSSNFEPSIILRLFLLLIVNFVYVSLILWKVVSYRRSLMNQVADISELRLEWMGFFAVCAGIFWCASALKFYLLDRGTISVATYAEWRVLLRTAFFFAFGVFALTQSRFFELYEKAKDLVIASQADEVMSNSGRRIMDDEQLVKLTNSLRDFIGRSKIFLDPNLDLPRLAEAWGQPRYVTTYVINRGLNLNFFSLINEFRIDHAKQLLAKANNGGKSIKELALHCGFNSKSVFNGVFKKLVGMTPTQFRTQSQTTIT